MKSREFILNNEPERASLLLYLQNAPLDKSLKVTVETVKSRRTLSQNSLMWKWIHEAAAALADDTGHTPEDIHEHFKRRFLSPRITEINGVTTERYTTTELDITEMSAYMTQIYAFVVGEMGIYLTQPGMTDASGAEITQLGGG